ncbi:hypothetical protein BZG36_04351 [Bifiguratus adelaidae]|uniref:glucan 1,4-alpha-glucosidase n=1 Tax=Bifiguratus adelaidae TaxID=1938954 RepID=A0A261XX60_9FUNG|nr:hypothetical protein BZG36_04351 [Bifiguratus adelaidae]
MTLKALAVGVLLGSSLLPVWAQSCNLTVVTNTIPSTPVALQSYSYCGGNLNVTVYIQNLCYNKVVNLYYTNGNNVSTPLSVISLGYQEEIPGTNYGWEFWTANAPVYVDGIDELLNVTYHAVDIGQTYYQILNDPVTASGAPIPTPPAPPKPYASPSTVGSDITTWLSPSGNSETVLSKRFMFNSINVPGAANGTVIAAQSYTAPDYAYNWVRDASLTMDVVNTFYAASKGAQKSMYESILFQYVQAAVEEQNDPGLQTGLGEPKFFLNNSIFTGPWGRPQNDGPATRAITLMNFANAYMKSGGSKQTVISQIWDSNTYPTSAPVLRDLLFVANNWSSPSFDLWEEESSDHFYTRMVQRRALIMGSQFAQQMGNQSVSSTLSAAANALTQTLSQFWDPMRNLILYEYGPILRGKSSFKDAAVLLGVLHGYANDHVYSYTDDKVLASAFELATSFLDIYPIANITQDQSGLTLGIPIGRYPEDTYNGVETTGAGNPWYLCTTTLAELFYRAAYTYTTEEKQITVTNASLPFWNYFAPQAKYTAGATYRHNNKQFPLMIASLTGWGDAFMRRVKYHVNSTDHLTEEYNRDTGAPTGATDLTWSYAALLTAAFARAQLLGSKKYVETLATVF